MGVKQEIKEVWVKLGRDPKKLRLDNKNRVQLEQGLEQLKAVEMSFKILFESEGNHNFALALLEGAFKEK